MRRASLVLCCFGVLLVAGFAWTAYSEEFRPAGLRGIRTTTLLNIYLVVATACVAAYAMIARAAIRLKTLSIGSLVAIPTVIGLAVLALPAYNDYLVHAVPSPSMRAFGDQKAWILLEPMRYGVGDSAEVIVVPAGFVTDLASIPPAFWGPPLFLTPSGQYGRAAIIHDYLYWSQRCTKDQADRLLVIAMVESQVSRFDRWEIYTGVSGWGKSSWEANSEARSDGFPRILPEQFRRPDDPNASWTAYSAGLVASGVRGIEPADNGEYCYIGNTLDVPLSRHPAPQSVRIIP